MKDKSWVIILIMTIALTISIAYSVALRTKAENAEKTVNKASIIEMTATTVTIKNTLTGTGNIVYKEIKTDIPSNQITENLLADNMIGNIDENNSTNIDAESIPKEGKYIITLSIEDKDLDKAKKGQTTEISVKKENQSLTYTGNVINISQNSNNKSTIDIEINNPDDQIEENMVANCTVIIEKAENVVALPIEAIQKDEEGKTFVDIAKDDGSTEKTYIETGISDDYYVEITNGLKVGDKVQIVKSSTTVVENSENKSTKNNSV